MYRWKQYKQKLNNEISLYVLWYMENVLNTAEFKYMTSEIPGTRSFLHFYQRYNWLEYIHSTCCYAFGHSIFDEIFTYENICRLCTDVI